MIHPFYQVHLIISSLYTDVKIRKNFKSFIIKTII